MNLAGCPAWGEHTLRLSLPGLGVNVTGLSENQRERLRAEYTAFCTDEESHAYQLELGARRFEAFTPPDSATLTRDGQYTPLKSALHAGDGFDLAGSNFQARLFTGGNAQSLVGVSDEGHLALANVFENVLRVLMAHRALSLHGAVLHSAGIVYRGQAYIFCGRSNAGKTTLSRKAHAQGHGILSDDINLVLPADDHYRAHAVPFTGEFGRTLDPPQRGSFPVAAIVLLRQGPQASVTPVSMAMASASLLAGCPFVNTDRHDSERAMDSVTAMAASVPTLQLTSAREDSFSAIMALVERQLDASLAPSNIQVQTLAQTRAQAS